MTSPVTKDHGASDERARFEAWADDQGFPLTKLETSDGYLDLRTQGPWEAWQAASADRLELLEALKDCTKFMERDLPMDIYFRARPEIAKARAAIDKHEGK